MPSADCCMIRKEKLDVCKKYDSNKKIASLERVFFQDKPFGEKKKRINNLKSTTAPLCYTNNFNLFFSITV